jgi:hypothetical protein
VTICGVSGLRSGSRERPTSPLERRLLNRAPVAATFAKEGLTLEIRVVSSLTPDDEARYAATFLRVIAAVLENAAITFAIQVQLRDGVVVHHTHGLKALEVEAPL